MVSKGKKLILHRKILETEPDELVFTPMFKDVNLDGDSVVVVDKHGDIIYSLKIDELNL